MAKSKKNQTDKKDTKKSKSNATKTNFYFSEQQKSVKATSREEALSKIKKSK
jgi:hypothetical protein